MGHNRARVFFLPAGVAALGLILAAHLDAGERRTEVATLVAVGGSGTAVLCVLALRSALVSAAGAAAGVAAGAAVAVGHDPAAVRLVDAWPLALAALGVAVTLGFAAAVPTAWAAVRRDPAADLQEN